MSCPRGSASPNASTRARLFASSAGYCQNSSCSRELFIDSFGKRIHVAEIAHVFAAKDMGPRANRELSEAERGAFENLILLCSNCHTIVDKASDQYTDTVIFGWKRDHATKLQAIFGVVRYETRAQARKAIEPPLHENNFIFRNLGPHNDQRLNPESEAAEVWRRKVVTRILPNNRRVLAYLDANVHLLTFDEFAVLEAFRQHVDDLEARHLEGYDEGGRTFPEGMGVILNG